MQFVPPSAVRLVAIAGCAALWVIVHVRLALRDRRERGRVRALVAWVVPGAAAWMAWRRGARWEPVAYGVLVALYAALWVGA